MEDLKKFMLKRNITTADKRSAQMQSYPLIESSSSVLDPPPQFFESFNDSDDFYDSGGNKRLEQTLYYEDEDFENPQLPNLDELEDVAYMSENKIALGYSPIESSVNDEKIDEIRSKVRRDGAPFTRTVEEFDIKPLTRFMLPEEFVRENDVAWEWDSLISDIMIHPDVVQLTNNSSPTLSVNTGATLMDKNEQSLMM